jgi:hypothetical protein
MAKHRCPWCGGHKFDVMGSCMATANGRRRIVKKTIVSLQIDMMACADRDCEFGLWDDQYDWYRVGSEEYEAAVSKDDWRLRAAGLT